MGEIQGRRNAWVYPEGGMGAVSASIARAALSYGVDIYTEQVMRRELSCLLIIKTVLLQPIKQIIVDSNSVRGVLLDDDTAIDANIVLSNATPKITFIDLLPKVLSKGFQRTIINVLLIVGLFIQSIPVNGFFNRLHVTCNKI